MNGPTTQRIIDLTRDMLLRTPRAPQQSIVARLHQEHGFHESTIKRALDLAMLARNLIRTGQKGRFCLEWDDEPAKVPLIEQRIVHRAAGCGPKRPMQRYANSIAWGMAHCLGK